MPKAAKFVGILIKLPPNMANAGWDIDADIVRAFAKAYGIKWNISFRFSSGQYTVGSHRVKRNDDGTFSHAITLSQDRDEAFSRATILHELCHAIQAEKEMRGNNPVHFYSRDSGAYSIAKRRYGYRNSPYEIEARSFAEIESENWGGMIY